MREIRIIGQRFQSGRNYLFSLFECSVCHKKVEKIRKDGVKSNACSHKCYATVRTLRGAYKGGVVEISGYLYEYNPSHPFSTKSGYVAQHRLVAERSIGRFLNCDEVAHHINEIKHDNRPENILVMTKSQHSKHHQNFRKCKTTD